MLLQAKKLAPGILLSLAVGLVALMLQRVMPGLSPLIVTIVLGMVFANLVKIPEVLSPGISWAAKNLLRWGIVFLGFQLSLGNIVQLGLPMLLVTVTVVVCGVLGTVGLGRLLNIKPSLALLIACGFSICGAAAVAGVKDLAEADEDDTVTAVALVVLFGTLMILFVPFATSLLGMSGESAGMWVGASTHEVAQVVAIGGIIGGGALAPAVIVKLTRVLMLAPLAMFLSLRLRKKQSADFSGAKPAIVPWFVGGFIAMVLLRSLWDAPVIFVSGASTIQTILLATAMFGLGCGVQFKKLMRVGFKPLILAAGSTVIVAGVSLAGVSLVA